jgi:hypothetical protein
MLGVLTLKSFRLYARRSTLKARIREILEKARKVCEERNVHYRQEGDVVIMTGKGGSTSMTVKTEKDAQEMLSEASWL